MHNFIRQVRAILTLCALLMALLTSTRTSADEPARVYSWSVVPQFTGLAVHRDWSPIIEYLNTHTPYRFNLRLYKSIPEFEQGFLAGETDFSYMNPYHAVMAKRAQGYRPIIRDGERQLTGILVVRKDSAYQQVQDLNEATIAFASPNAFAAALYMRALLTEKENITFTPYYAKTHTNAYRQVLLGKTAAAGGVYRTLKKERTEVTDNLRVIYTTPSTPSHPLTANPRVPTEVITAVQAHFALMYADSTYQPLLNAILIPEPIEADYDRDYRGLEELHLESYVGAPEDDLP